MLTYEDTSFFSLVLKFSLICVKHLQKNIQNVGAFENMVGKVKLN